MTTSRDADSLIGEAAGQAPIGVGHELRDIGARPVALAFVALGIVGVLVSVLIYVLLARLTAKDLEQSDAASPLAASYGRKAPPEPRLQVAPRDDLHRLHEREDALLHGYAWVDRQADVARIPIDRAIEILAARGLPPAAAPGAAGAAGNTAGGAR